MKKTLTSLEDINDFTRSGVVAGASFVREYESTYRAQVLDILSREPAKSLIKVPTTDSYSLNGYSSMLPLAIYINCFPFAQDLLDAGCPINNHEGRADIWWKCASSWYIRKTDEEIRKWYEFLFANGLDVKSFVSSSPFNATAEAAVSGSNISKETVKWAFTELIERGASMEGLPGDSETAISSALRLASSQIDPYNSLSYDLIKMLLDHGASPNRPIGISYWISALHYKLWGVADLLMNDPGFVPVSGDMNVLERAVRQFSVGRGDAFDDSLYAKAKAMAEKFPETLNVSMFDEPEEFEYWCREANGRSSCLWGLMLELKGAPVWANNDLWRIKIPENRSGQ